MMVYASVCQAAKGFFLLFFFFNDTATTEIYTLSLHDALPIYICRNEGDLLHRRDGSACHPLGAAARFPDHGGGRACERYGLPRIAPARKGRPDPLAVGTRDGGALRATARAALLPVDAGRGSCACHGGGAFPLSRAIGSRPESRALKDGHAGAVRIALVAGRRFQAGPAAAPRRLAARVGSGSLVVAEQPSACPLHGDADASGGPLLGRIRRFALPPQRKPKLAHPRFCVVPNSRRVRGRAGPAARGCRRGQRRAAPNAQGVPRRPISRRRPLGRSFADRAVHGTAARRTRSPGRFLERAISSARGRRHFRPLPNRRSHGTLERARRLRGERGPGVLFRSGRSRGHGARLYAGRRWALPRLRRPQLRFLAALGWSRRVIGRPSATRRRGAPARLPLSGIRTGGVDARRAASERARAGRLPAEAGRDAAGRSNRASQPDRAGRPRHKRRLGDRSAARNRRRRSYQDADIGTTLPRAGFGAVRARRAPPRFSIPRILGRESRAFAHRALVRRDRVRWVSPRNRAWRYASRSGRAFVLAVPGDARLCALVELGRST